MSASQLSLVLLSLGSAIIWGITLIIGYTRLYTVNRFILGTIIALLVYGAATIWDDALDVG